MAANGFIELLRLAKRGNHSIVSEYDEENRWSGIAFEMLGQTFVAPLGEVLEVIYPPKYTPVPNAQNWVRGLANIRGRLLAVADLAQFIAQQRSHFSPTQKVLCISYKEHYVGLLVDRVLGIQHFNKRSFFSNNEELDQSLNAYCQGYFQQNNQLWHVFLFSRLLNNPQFMNASVRLIN